MSNITLLDGGLGQAINSRSMQDKSHSLWSVQVAPALSVVVVRLALLILSTYIIYLSSKAIPLASCKTSAE